MSEQYQNIFLLLVFITICNLIEFKFLLIQFDSLFRCYLYVSLLFGSILLGVRKKIAHFYVIANCVEENSYIFPLFILRGTEVEDNLFKYQLKYNAMILKRIFKNSKIHITYVQCD